MLPCKFPHRFGAWAGFVQSFWPVCDDPAPPQPICKAHRHDCTHHQSQTFHRPDDNRSMDGYPTTALVHAFTGNGYGLYNMVGNVWEWSENAFRIKFLKRSVRARLKGMEGFRLSKGGGFFVPSQLLLPDRCPIRNIPRQYDITPWVPSGLARLIAPRRLSLSIRSSVDRLKGRGKCQKHQSRVTGQLTSLGTNHSGL